jgi:hypothetical protein
VFFTYYSSMTCILGWSPFLTGVAIFLCLLSSLQLAYLTQVHITPLLPTREYSMIYRGPGFLTVEMIWLLPTPPPPPPSSSQQVVSLSQSSCFSRSRFLKEEGGVGVGCGRSQITQRRESLVLDKSSIYPLFATQSLNL